MFLKFILGSLQNGVTPCIQFRPFFFKLVLRIGLIENIILLVPKQRAPNAVTASFAIVAKKQAGTIGAIFAE